MQARRLYGHSRFLPFITVLMGLYILSIYSSPYETRGWVLLFRPAAGIWLMLTISEVIFHQRRHIVTTILQISYISIPLALITITGIGAIQWTGKTEKFHEITRHLPQWQDFSWWKGGLNINEWSGAAAWIIPVLVGAAGYRLGGRALTIATFFIASINLLVLSMGQSASAITGVAASLALLITPRGKLKYTLFIAGLGLLIINFIVLSSPRTFTEGMSAIFGTRDHSLEHRAAMWERAQVMIGDYPLTGVGIAMYRNLRSTYPIPGYEQEPLPHPHNELLQFATDLGIPGMVIYGVLIWIVGQCAINAARHGMRTEYAIAISVTAGLFAHAVYGLADAIPLWDRFAFVMWWMLGILSGIDAAITARQAAPEPDNPPSA